MHAHTSWRGSEVNCQWGWGIGRLRWHIALHCTALYQRIANVTAEWTDNTGRVSRLTEQYGTFSPTGKITLPCHLSKNIADWNPFLMWLPVSVQEHTQFFGKFPICRESLLRNFHFNFHFAVMHPFWKPSFEKKKFCEGIILKMKIPCPPFMKSSFLFLQHPLQSTAVKCRVCSKKRSPLFIVYTLRTVFSEVYRWTRRGAIFAHPSLSIYNTTLQKKTQHSTTK